MPKPTENQTQSNAQSNIPDRIETLSPLTGKVLASYSSTTSEEIETILKAASELVKSSRKDPNTREKRKRLLLKMADLLDAEKSEHALLITEEMGKTLKASEEEIAKCVVTLRHAVQLIDSWLGVDEIFLGNGKTARLEYHALGTVLAVMPWNFPYWQVIRAFIPAALLGNTFVLKHASNVTGCAKKLEALVTEAGGPAGLFSTVILRGDKVLPLIDDPRIHAVTLTGSEPAGRELASRAGRALKKVVLELGGSDPFIVCASAASSPAALARVVDAAVKSRLLSNGQSCICAKRFLIDESIYSAFVDRLKLALGAVKMGSPLEPDTSLGPIATENGKNDLKSLREDALKCGAREVFTGTPSSNPDDLFFPVSVLEGIPESAKLRKEESFGPIFSLYRFATHDEAVDLANETPFGLGASVWTEEAGERTLFTNQLEAGMIFFNSMVASDGRVPFGGTKHSGFGRELGEAGMKEFALIKTVVQTLEQH